MFFQALLLAGAFALAPLSARATDLLDVYRLARQADPVLAAAHATRRVADEGVTQSRAPLLPQLSAGLSFEQRRDGSEPDGRQRSRDASASLSQIVFDLGRSAQVGVAQSLADAQAASLRAAEQALCVRVAGAYFDVLSATDMLANLEAVEDAYRRQVEQADQRYHNGLTALVDVDQARAYHASAQARTIEARSALADTIEALGEITGAPAGTLKALRADLPLTPPAPAESQTWVTRALDQNPSLLAQQRSVDAAERSISAARAGHAPTLTAGVNVGRSALWPAGAVSDSTNGRSITTVGLMLNVPLFSGGAVESRLRQAVAQRDGSREDFEARRRRIARDTLDHYRGVLSGIGQIEANRRAVDAAGKALESTRIGLSLGTQTMTDLLLAIQTLASARDALSQARHRLVVARLLLLRDVGTIDETDLAAVNALLE